MIRYTISEYARLTGTSKAAVYKKLDTSLKPYLEKDGRRCFLVFQDEAAAFNPVSTPAQPISTPFQPGFDPVSTPGSDNFNPDSTPAAETVNPISTPTNAEEPGEAAILQEQVKGLRAILDAKDETIKALTASVERLTAELEQERKASQELRQLMNQQQALTMKHLEGTKRRPLLAAIFPRWYEHGQDHQVDD